MTSWFRDRLAIHYASPWSLVTLKGQGHERDLRKHYWALNPKCHWFPSNGCLLGITEPCPKPDILTNRWPWNVKVNGLKIVTGEVPLRMSAKNFNLFRFTTMFPALTMRWPWKTNGNESGLKVVKSGIEPLGTDSEHTFHSIHCMLKRFPDNRTYIIDFSLSAMQRKINNFTQVQNLKDPPATLMETTTSGL